MSKYGAKRTEVDGVVFASRGEARRYRDLTLAQAAGAIAGLELQVRYPLVVNGVKIADYVCDFRYTEGGRQVVEDFKGVRTPAYRLKKKLVKALYDIDILESEA